MEPKSTLKMGQKEMTSGNRLATKTRNVSTYQSLEMTPIKKLHATVLALWFLTH
jgi:hypothetical protein